MAITKITNSLVSVNAIHGTLIADNAITSVHIAQNQVTAVQIPDGSITATQLGANSVDSSELVDGSIDTSHIADAQITTAKLGTNQVTSAKIAQNSIEARHIADGSITDTQLGSGAFTMGTITTTGAIRGPASLTIDPATVGDNTGTVVIAGNLQVDGTTTTVNSTTVDIVDKNITLGKGGSASANNGGGITIDGAAATLLYNHSDTSWQMNKPLGVTGNAAFTGGITATYANLSSAVNALYFRTAAANTDYNLITRNNTGNALFIQSAQSNTNQPIANFRYGSATVNQGTPVLQVSKDNSHFVNCNVGIGTAAPSSLLTVAGTSDLAWSAATSKLQISRSGAVARLQNYESGSASTNLALQWEGGKVGIGETSPDGLLHLKGGTATGDASHILFENTQGSKVFAIGGGATGVTNSNLFFRNVTDNTRPMVITDAGKVGIGTSTPNEVLEVTGSIRVDNGASFTAYQVYRDNIQYGVVGGGGNQFTIQASNNKDIRIFDDSGAGLTVKDGGNVGIGTGVPTATLEVAGTALVENAKLKAIAASNTDTAIDVFIYDTRKDSDGGAWRKRTQHTSWYNETLNTSTRGARKEFPSVAVIVVEAAKVTIYDGDDPDMPMWMVFSGDHHLQSNTTYPARAITALNGSIVKASIVYGIAEVNFIKDTGDIYWHHAQHRKSLAPISGRNSTQVYTNDTDRLIVDDGCNDVAMTVLPNAPIDADTGLPVPTIAVATDGGISIIRDNGVVVDIISNSGSAYTPTSFVDIDDNYNLIFEQDSGGRSLMFIPIPSADRTTVANDGDRTDKRMLPTSSTGTGLNLIPRFNGSNASIAISGKGDDQYIYGGTGLTAYSFGGSKLQSSVAYITSDYNTGYMVGDIKLATLSDTSTTNVTGGTQPDRSYNNNALNVTGTITKTAVATGAELVAYSGWSTSNYLEQPYNSDLDFGTGDFSFTGWVYPASGSTNYKPIITKCVTNQSETTAINIKIDPSFNLYVYTTGVTSPTVALTQNVWSCFTVTRISGTLKLYVNGVLGDSENWTSVNITNTSSKLRVGVGGTSLNESATGVKVALVRVSATAPTAEQIAKMYNDEKHLFAINAKATLHGTSNAVTALAYDDATELLHIGTSAGRSEFQGLNRVNNTTDAVGIAISASNGLVAED